MFQLSFLNTGLLIFAAATILPLIIWLLAKKKPPQIIFSTIRFIRNTEKEQKSRTQLKNILLLIIRMLIILLIVLAASRPSLRIPNLKPAQKHPPTAFAIILDTSYSMDYTAVSKSTLDIAKSYIQEINKRLNPQDLVVLITSDESWNRLNSQLLSGNISDNLLNSIRPTWLPLTMDKLLEYAENKLSESQYSNREIYILSDGQKQNLPAKTNLPVIIIPLPEPTPWSNISCANAKPIMQLTSKQQSQLIQFDLTNHGNSVCKDILVRVDINGVKAAEKFVSLQPGESLTETLPVQISSSGWQSGYVEVLDEKLTADNRSWFAFSYTMNPKIGVITQRNSLPLILNTMLSVFATAQGSVRIVSPQQVNFQQLRSFDLVVVYDAGELSPRIRGLLQDMNKARRGVLYCADANLNSAWKSFLNQQFGIQIGSYGETSQTINFVNSYHSVTALFDARQMKRVQISDFWTAKSTGSANVLLSAENSPVAIAGTSSILWMFDPDSVKNRFLLDASFPVFAFRSMQYLANSRFEDEQMTVGQFIAADEIILPGDDKIELGGNTFRTYEPGIYTLNWRAGESQKLAIQPDYTESDYLPMAYPQSKSYHILGNNWKEGLFLARLGHDIWKYLLIAALLLFLLEIILVKSEEWKAARE